MVSGLFLGAGVMAFAQVVAAFRAWSERRDAGPSTPETSS
jgi:hypothetical protein